MKQQVLVMGENSKIQNMNPFVQKFIMLKTAEKEFGLEDCVILKSERNNIVYLVEIARPFNFETDSFINNRLCFNVCALKLKQKNSLNSRKFVDFGYANVELEGDKIACIRGIEIEKEYRGQGLGGALINFVQTYLKNKGVNFIWLESLNAIRRNEETYEEENITVKFYENHGFCKMLNDENNFNELLVNKLIELNANMNDFEISNGLTPMYKTLGMVCDKPENALLQKMELLKSLKPKVNAPVFKNVSLKTCDNGLNEQQNLKTGVKHARRCYL